MSGNLPELHVVAGLLFDAEGRVLLAQRTAGREDAGLWEFPGGKLEAQETACEALQRELAEELGVEIACGRSLIRVPQRQPRRLLWLEAIEVRHWRGTPRGLEGQSLRWLLPEQIDPALLPAADRPILASLLQPETYWISPTSVVRPALLDDWIAEAAGRGAIRLQLRVPDLDGEARASLSRYAAARSAELGIELLLNARTDTELELAAALGCGVQLSHRLLLSLARRPQLPVVAASCHDRESLCHAERLGCDFALLSPVLPTPSHPGAPGLGWPGFSELRAWTCLPVYALGGVGPLDLAQARAAGAQGVAGIRGFLRAQG